MQRRLGAVVLLVVALAVACDGTERGGRAASGASAATAVDVAFAEVSSGAAAYEVRAELPVVTGVDPAVADGIERHTRAWVDDLVRTFEEDDAEFRGDAAGLDDLPPGLLEVRGVSAPAEPAVVSIVFTVTAMHQGMAHPWTTVEAFTYELSSGRTVTLEDLFAPGQDVLGTISDAAVPALRAVLDPEGEGWADEGILAGAGPDAEALHRFVVGEDGLTIHFDQYQVAPGAAGQQAVTLGWDDLLERLEPSPLLRTALER